MLEPGIWETLKHIISISLFSILGIFGYFGKRLFRKQDELETIQDKMQVKVAVLQSQLDQIADLKRSMSEFQHDIRHELASLRSDIHELLANGNRKY